MKLYPIGTVFVTQNGNKWKITARRAHTFRCLLIAKGASNWQDGTGADFPWKEIQDVLDSGGYIEKASLFGSLYEKLTSQGGK